MTRLAALLFLACTIFTGTANAQWHDPVDITSIGREYVVTEATAPVAVIVEQPTAQEVTTEVVVEEVAAPAKVEVAVTAPVAVVTPLAALLLPTLAATTYEPRPEVPPLPPPSNLGSRPDVPPLPPPSNLGSRPGVPCGFAHPCKAE